MSTAATVESTASATDRAATVEAPSTANRATVESTDRATSGETTARKTTTSEATSAEATPVAPAAAAVEATSPSAPAPVIPRAGADEDSAGKPTRPVISIRGTRVRIVAVVTIVADWSRPNIARADTHAHADLRLRVGQWNHQNCQ